MLIDAETTRLAQQRLFEMGSAIADVLEGEGIPYCLALGTLLGAVRHGGFIPWDDDFDLWLFDDTYDDAIEVLRKGLPAEMFVEDIDSEPLYFHSWAHVKDLNTVVEYDEFPQDSLYAHKGLSVDLYKLTRLKSTELGAFIESENRSYIRRRYEKGLMGENELHRREKALAKAIAEGAWDLSGPQRDVLGFSLFYARKHIEINEMTPLRTYSFEGRCFSGPADAESVLSGYYGDWWSLPEPDKRVAYYSRVEFLV